MINKGDKVKIEYTGKFSDGQVFDKSEGRGPLTFEIGAKQVVPGFEKAVEGMEKGQEKTFTLTPEEGYGAIRAELTQEVPREHLPKDQEPKIGMMLMMQSPTGQQIPAKIAKVTEDKVTLDLNHPLAGKELTFTVKVIGVNDPEDKKDGCCGSGSCSDSKDKEGCGDSHGSCNHEH
ncbi:peptidylprolyl isomerase [Candidatus Woesearchaeota archaeon]|nr:peptidylprolyl isomerase [Candidatus Woesearchaeota archaeon]MBT5740208.1 peptidylprolyl isomerase [Candidatus Woesearchaeota archaeon]